MAQKYKNNFIFKKKLEISGYHLLILIINQKELCAKMGISISYIKHLPMFSEYLELQKVYDKNTYIYARLGEKYKMHPNSVRRIITNMLHVESVSA